MNEFDLIKTYFAPLAISPDAFGLKDDVAALNPPAGRQLIITTDTLVESVHFLSEDPLETVAQKLLRVNISDVLAKGGTPWAAVLSLTWPSGRDVRQLSSFADGLKADLEHWGISLMGGDTTSTSGPLTLGLTLLAHCPQTGPILRSGGKQGDDIWVTGSIGDGYLGLKAAMGELSLSRPEDVALLAWRYRVPEIPDSAIAELISEVAHASADVSDGLVADINHIAKASNLQAIINLDEVPFSSAAKLCLAEKKVSRLELVTKGDDYQSVFTAPPEAKAVILRASLQYGLEITKIGTMQTGQGVSLQRPNGTMIPIKSDGWKHF
ncbi:thiamine-phosphate kinase [Hirschia baltica]|uniref:Thiamine-monophosphate kinase n=1 Tax=Hirschia baltica (strain ATCC 49814 / DSM 5838 / IFAM 1418) TaxID=582402 RepID=C6XIX6_HIRBI|nr:thiamine-phosphate kinase [Hirschia baltica]ACT59071.1 thiamine-monophosphate kinase [Hirschia baltica ATCC 49814]